MVTTLNPRQLLFAQSVVAGMSLTDAYREAGYSGEGHVAHAGASKLMAKPAIASFVESQQQVATVAAIADRRELIGRLTRVLRADADSLEHDPPIQQITRRTVTKADGTEITYIRSHTLSRHAAIRQLTRMLADKHPDRTAREALLLQRDRDQARSEVQQACDRMEDARSASGAASSAPVSYIDPDSAHCVVRIGRHLNPRQRLFCEHLCKGIPAIRAYVYAGYGEGNYTAADAASASRLLKRPAIVHYLRELQLAGSGMDPGEGEGNAASPTHADRGEILTYLTHATRASGDDLRSQGRFIDQIVREEVEISEAITETRVWVKSIHVPRAISQLSTLLGPPDPVAEADDPEFQILRDLLAAAAEPLDQALPPAADRVWADSY